MSTDVKERNLISHIWNKKDVFLPKEENYYLEDQKSPLPLNRASYVT